MARPYNDREPWGDDDDWRERDERRFRHGGEERGRYGTSDLDRGRYRGAPDREVSSGWSTDRGSNARYDEEHRAREYWRSRENAPWRVNEQNRGGENWRTNERDDRPGSDWRDEGQAHGSRGFELGGEERRNANLWLEDRHDRDARSERNTLRGIGSGQEQWGSAFQGFGRTNENRRGGFAGKGPRGYTRSDERIREDVCDRLSADDEVDASDVTVTVTKAEVTLEGTVPDRHSKRRAEDVVESVTGVTEVHNRLRSNKGLVQEVGDKLMGRANESGHAGSGTRNTPAGPTSAQNNH
jgi:hypothetical protein